VGETTEQIGSIALIAQRFNEGGSYMVVLLVILAISAAILVERMYFYFVTCRKMNAIEAGVVAKSIEEGTEEQQLETLNKRNDPLSGLLYVALDRFKGGADMDQIQEGIDEEAITQVPRIGERLSYLALIANVATLLGLLGTIAGLQDSFASLDSADKGALALGIAKAMNTTAFGLIVAVPAMVAYSWLNAVKSKQLRNLDDAMLRMVNFMNQKRKDS